MLKILEYFKHSSFPWSWVTRFNRY